MLKSESVIGATPAKHFCMQGRDYLSYEDSNGRLSWARVVAIVVMLRL